MEKIYEEVEKEFADQVIIFFFVVYVTIRIFIYIRTILYSFTPITQRGRQ